MMKNRIGGATPQIYLYFLFEPNVTTTHFRQMGTKKVKNRSATTVYLSKY